MNSRHFIVIAMTVCISYLCTDDDSSPHDLEPSEDVTEVRPWRVCSLLQPNSKASCYWKHFQYGAVCL